MEVALPFLSVSLLPPSSFLSPVRARLPQSTWGGARIREFENPRVLTCIATRAVGFGRGAGIPGVAGRLGVPAKTFFGGRGKRAFFFRAQAFKKKCWGVFFAFGGCFCAFRGCFYAFGVFLVFRA